MRAHRREIRRVAGEAALVALLLATAAAIFVYTSQTSRFQGDESNYMMRGRYFVYLFVRGDVNNPFWSDRYHAFTQPMLGNYLIGATLWLAGRDPEQFTGYDWRRPFAENVRMDRVPDRATLALIRAPLIALAVGSVALLYALGRILGGPMAGLVAGVIVVASPLSHWVLVRARNDGLLVFFLLLALLLSMLGARRGGAGELSLRWALAVGFALGLAFAAKLTGLLSIGAILVWSGLVAVAAAAGAGADWATRVRAAWRAARGWLLAVLIGLGLFLALNPQLWPDPADRSWTMFEHRRLQMISHQQSIPGSAVHNLLDRPLRAARGALISSPRLGSMGVPVEAVLAVLGGVALLVRALRGWRNRRLLTVEALFLTTAVIVFGGVSAALYVSWGWYHLPTFVLAAVMAGVGVTALWSQARGWLTRRRGQVSGSS